MQTDKRSNKALQGQSTSDPGLCISLYPSHISRVKNEQRHALAQRAAGRYGPLRNTSLKDGNSHMLSLLNLVSTVIQLYIYALFIFIILGWLVQFNVINSQNRFVYLVMDFLYRVTEPLLRPIRNVLPNLGGLDISPIVLVLGLSFLRSLMWEYLG